MRQMAGKRMGPPAPKDEPSDTGDAEPVDEGKADPKEAAEKMPDVIQCPECGCEINTMTGKAINDDGSEPDKSKLAQMVRESLDTSDSQYSTPGKFGTSNDATQGSNAQTKALGSLASLKG